MLVTATANGNFFYPGMLTEMLWDLDIFVGKCPLASKQKPLLLL